MSSQIGAARFRFAGVLEENPTLTWMEDLMCVEAVVVEHVSLMFGRVGFGRCWTLLALGDDAERLALLGTDQRCVGVATDREPDRLGPGLSALCSSHSRRRGVVVGFVRVRAIETISSVNPVERSSP